MPGPDTISPQQLSRLIGTAEAPTLIDVRMDDDFAADPRVIPAAERRDYTQVADWANEYKNRNVVVTCQKGLKLSQGVAAWLRQSGISAETLDGGHLAWAAAGQMLVKNDALPKRDHHGRTVWVTRARPKIDRIACPWLIRRFVDRNAVFLYVQQSEVPSVAEKFNATPFDIDGVFWSHRGEKCTFDVMLAEFGLQSEALDRLAAIVRGADTDRLDLAPQAAGLLAASLGLSRMFKDDLAQLDASMLLYDSFYRWCRDAVGETHTWPNPASPNPGSPGRGS